MYGLLGTYTIDSKEKNLKIVLRPQTGGVKARRSSIPWNFLHMSNKGGAGILVLPDDFCDFFSLERVYGCNLLF
jgi:hypothetical protein